MFVKATKSKSHTYIQIVESYRDQGKVKHRTIANLGRLDNLIADKSLEAIGNKLLALADSPLVNLNELVEQDRICYGNIVYEKLWNRLGLDAILDQCLDSRSSMSYNLVETLRFIVIHKLLQGTSKLDAFTNRDRFYNLAPHVELHHIYKSLDFLAEHKEVIESALFNKGRDLFNNDIDVAFYDVTTFHFESNRADDLRDFGFSKAGKVNEVQVVLGLFTDKQGVPIGYELFPGNTFDGKTMINALASLSQRFNINKVIIVADKGLNSKANFHLIRQAGYDYIVACKLKSQSKHIQDQVFDSKDYTDAHVDKSTGEVTFRVKTVDLPVAYKDEEKNTQAWTDRLVITWSSKRANKDNRDRQRQVDKAAKLIEGRAEMTNKKGARRYITTEQKTKASLLDQAQIDKDAKWDGYYGIQFSKTTLSQTEVLEAYKGLWRIEQSFRIMKTTMHVRPIYHWTPKRIKGHFMMCFIGFLLERHLELKLQEKNINLSSDRIKKSLNHLQLSKVKHRQKFYYMKGSNGEYGAKILRALNIKPLANVQLIN